VDDDRPPICPTCGVTMVPAALSARDGVDGDWICLECEETEPEASEQKMSRPPRGRRPASSGDDL